ncbi:phage minor capsid protein [Bacillus albus]|uniref:phage minor capsid protein n=1 Tax=Bacillus albus TaxID=2026189 RepID=UPI00301572EB
MKDKRIEPSYVYNVGRLVRIYQRALKNMQAQIDQMEIADLNRATGIALMHNIQMELIKVDKEAAEWIKENVPLAAKEGIAQTLHALGYADTIEAAYRIARFSQVNSDMARVAAADTMKNVLAITDNMAKEMQRGIRKVSMEVIAQGIATSRNSTVMSDQLKEKIKELKKELKDSVDTGIIDKSGRRWSVEHYTDMLARTKLTEIQKEATTNEAIDRGAYYATISFNGSTKDSCRFHQGRIIKLTMEAEGNYPTYDQLKGTGQIFHPNCKHHIVPFRDYEKLDDHSKEIAKRQEKIGEAAEKAGGRDPNLGNEEKS